MGEKEVRKSQSSQGIVDVTGRVFNVARDKVWNCPLSLRTQEYGPNEMGTNGSLLMLMHVLYGNNKDLLAKVIPLRPNTFVLTLNKTFVILK